MFRFLCISLATLGCLSANAHSSGEITVNCIKIQGNTYEAQGELKMAATPLPSQDAMNYHCDNHPTFNCDNKCKGKLASEAGLSSPKPPLTTEETPALKDFHMHR